MGKEWDEHLKKNYNIQMAKGEAKDVNTNHWKKESSKQCQSFNPTNGYNQEKNEK